MSQNYIRLFYLEILLLAAITVVVLPIAAKTVGADAGCPAAYWSFVPYLSLHGDEVCRAHVAPAIIAIYYVLSLLLMVLFQVLYLRGRGGLRIIDKPKFATVFSIILFVLVCWLLGRESDNALFNFRVHKPGAWGSYVIPVIVPSFQFILSILMLEERG